MNNHQTAMREVIVAEGESGSETFRLSPQDGSIDLWLRGSKPRPVFFREWLPACFSRELEFDVWLPGESVLEWVFTGPEGKVTIMISSNELVLQQSFHDSFYLHAPDKLFDQDFEVSRDPWFQREMSEFDGVSGINVHPERKWTERKHTLDSEVRSIAATLSHDMELAIYVNGEKVFAQSCLQDLTRHQLRLSDASGSYSGRLVTPPHEEVTVTVIPECPHQTMIGFGGTAIPTAYAELCPSGKALFWEFVEKYNLRIQRENPIAGELKKSLDNWDDLDAAIPHYYGDSFPNGNISDFKLNAEFHRRGGEVWFEYWHFPKWMVHEGKTFIDEKGRERTNPVKVDEYVRSIVDYCHKSRKYAGRPPTIVGVQNESSQDKETYHAMVAGLRRALDDAGFKDVRIHMSDANMLSPTTNWGKLYADAITRAKTFSENPETWAAIDYAAAHMYDFQECFSNPDAFDEQMEKLREIYGDKPFLSTELCVNSPRYQMRSYRLALIMGQLAHKNLSLLNASALIYCWTLLNVEQPSYAWTRSLLTIDRSNGFMPVPSSHQLRIFGAWSRRIRKGMKRLETKCLNPNLLVTAYSDEKGGQTLVALNRSTAPMLIILDGLDTTAFKWRENVSPYEPNTVHEWSKGSEPLSIPPGTLVTLTNVPLGCCQQR